MRTYDESVRIWFERNTDRTDVDWTKPINFDVEVLTSMGCPTCGPETEVFVSVAYSTIGGGNRAWEKPLDRWDGGISRLTKEILTISQEDP